MEDVKISRGGGVNTSSGEPSSEKQKDKYTIQDLVTMQSWPLERKIQVTQTRILEWYQRYEGQVYISFSGGKDSTVLADLAARVCKAHGYKLILWFSNTGLEYPEIVKHIKQFTSELESNYEIPVELIIDYPKDRKGKRITFKNVIFKYGYPILSKEQAQFIYEYRTTKSPTLKEIRWSGNKWGRGKIAEKYKYLVDAPFMIGNKCCNVMKKSPAKKYEKRSGNHPILGTMAEESSVRTMDWLKHGCNAFEKLRATSQPLSFWTTYDILKYLKQYNLSYPSVYGEIVKDENGKLTTTGINRTGCIFCGFGCHSWTEPNKFQQLKQTHPKLWNYCMKPISEGGLGMKEVLDFIGVKYE